MLCACKKHGVKCHAASYAERDHRGHNVEPQVAMQWRKSKEDESHTDECEPQHERALNTEAVNNFSGEPYAKDCHDKVGRQKGEPYFEWRKGKYHLHIKRREKE